MHSTQYPLRHVPFVSAKKRPSDLQTSNRGTIPAWDCSATGGIRVSTPRPSRPWLLPLRLHAGALSIQVGLPAPERWQSVDLESCARGAACLEGRFFPRMKNKTACVRKLLTYRALKALRK